MKRDWDIIRDVLLFAENTDERSNEVYPLTLPNHDPWDVYYNAKKAIEAGLIEGDAVMGNPPPVYVSGLTWYGHDFLDAIRSDTVWNKTKKQIAEHASSAPLEVVKEVATKILTTMMLGL